MLRACASSPSRLITVIALLLATVIVSVSPQRAIAQDTTITIVVAALVIDNPNGASAYTPGYSYSTSGVLPGVSVSPAPGETILAFHTEGAIVGQGVTGSDGTVTLTIRGGLDYFILNAADTQGYSASTDGTIDAAWAAIYNPYQTETPTESTAAPTIPDAAPTATAETESGTGGTDENPANAEPSATMAASSTDADDDESADASSEAGADTFADPSAEPGSAGTGSPAAIYAGTCDTADFTGDPVAVLSETTLPEGDVQGADDASAVETSTTTLGMPLDDILADDHVLVVFDEDDDTVPLACGAIGGIVTDDGTLAFGLPAVGESRYAGVGSLTEDGDQTDATIFLAEDLDGGDATPAA